ncbi:hypothetical protein K3179_02795 [Qipengyuania sp. GH38]|uniref:Uncharacterized protein n=1 Tax=Qipengyuania aquimaris TaxID=255984 RepID=A0A6I4TI63_9SPHN|nr:MULTISPECIES: hypothetical protein [Qipengyuania]MBX7513469.1 hypothetical protein [Qipengyuania intermedia]MXO94899.1 hypothetical protein [Qipengyuania aquimaris]
MAAGKTCPKCEGRMEEGFTVDRGYGEAHVPGWHKGAPDKRWWGLKVDKKSLLAIESWRCNRCGYLEHYAR